MSMKSLFLFGLLAGGVSADLRQASQPKNNFAVRQRGAVQFEAKTALYMEPSAFQYAGLAAQRANAYDNFLRSNIDNEQDRRNFNTEAGRDMLPFRSFEAAMTDASGTVQNKLPADNPAMVATPGTPFVVPLRWNNPHASELEVNVWISNNQYVVPIRKPTCSGEGHQDNVFTFTIPQDFNQLGSVVPGFAGCKKVGDCVLQIYAHSVEPRTYAIGTPIIINGDVPAATATTTAGIQPAQQDVALDLTKLTRDLCLSSADPAADITTAVPRVARLVSDVYNHAYQNSDYSPYSGQQPEAISRNLQAAAVVGMIPSNQGELGKALFKQTNPAGAAAQQALQNKVKNLVKAYEGVVNNIINKVGDKTMANSDTMGATGTQKTATAFRAAEVGATTATRLRTNTYVPSFQLPAAQIAAAKALVPAKYAQLIDADGTVQIYANVLNDLKAEFVKASALGLNYLGPMIKKSATTMTDATSFRKLNAAGQRDGGVYAAGLAAAAKKAAGLVAPKITVGTNISPLSAALAADDGTGTELPDIGTDPIKQMPDMDALMGDSNCDDDSIPDGPDGLPIVFCQPPRPLFAESGTTEGAGLLSDQQAPQDTSSSSNLPLIIGIAAGASALILVAIVGAVVYRRKKQTTTVQHTSHATRDNIV